MTTRDGMSLEEAVSAARAQYETKLTAGLDQAALEEAARQGFANGAFEESEEELPEVLEEFFPEQSPENATSRQVTGKQNLHDKLESKYTR